MEETVSRERFPEIGKKEKNTFVKATANEFTFYMRTSQKLVNISKFEFKEFQKISHKIKKRQMDFYVHLTRTSPFMILINN